jgi:hypothetical protein
MREQHTELTIQTTYRSSFSDVLITLGAMTLLLVPLAWPSLKVIFAL